MHLRILACEKSAPCTETMCHVVPSRFAPRNKVSLNAGLSLLHHANAMSDRSVPLRSKLLLPRTGERLPPGFLAYFIGLGPACGNNHRFCCQHRRSVPQRLARRLLSPSGHHRSRSAPLPFAHLCAVHLLRLAIRRR